MKTLILAAMLSVSGIALAQTEEMTQDTTEETMTDMATEADTTAQTMPPAEATPPMETLPPADTTAPMTATTPSAPMPSSMPMGAATTVAPSNANPERDARGIPVVSAPAPAPAGANQPVSVPPGATVVPNSNQAGVFATQQPLAEYQACTRTVTDNCVQTYERGRGN